MILGILNETNINKETRIALIPQVITKIKKWKNVKVLVENNAGDLAGYSDESLKEAGAEICNCDRVLEEANIIIMINYLQNYIKLKEGTIVIGQFDPYRNKDILDKMQKAKIISLSMDMVPRSTIAQKMDVLSSQSSLAGYRMVVEATKLVNKIFPMMTTPSGTITPMKVFIIGAGVAGLQAIATAKRMGANVSAFDTRSAVEEQIKSLGAKFIKIDLGDTGQTKDGYAKALTPEQLKLQQEKMAKTCIQSDIVITTAKLFGRQAPMIIPNSIIKQMKKDSLIIDMAVDTGGNVEGSKPNELVNIDGVKIYGYGKPELDVAYHASQMYANNIYAFLEMFWKQEEALLDLETEHEILEAMILTKNGKIVHNSFKSE